MGRGLSPESSQEAVQNITGRPRLPAAFSRDSSVLGLMRADGTGSAQQHCSCFLCPIVRLLLSSGRLGQLRVALNHPCHLTHDSGSGHLTTHWLIQPQKPTFPTVG